MTKDKITEIYIFMKNINCSIKDIKIQTTANNGRVRELEKKQIINQKDIELIKAIKETETKLLNRIDDWSRAKLILYGTVIFSFLGLLFGGLILWLIKKIIDSSLSGG